MLTLTLALALAGPAGCGSAPEVPDTPDISHLLSAYAEPAGRVDMARSGSWLDESATQLDLLGGGQADLLLAGIAAAAFRAVDQASLPTGREGVVPTRIDGVATLSVPCGTASHETADVSVAIVDGAASPLIWGTSHACPLWQTLGSREAYDGRFTMYRYPSSELLVRVDGMLTGAEANVNVDFRLSGGRLETRIATLTGDVIVARDGKDVVARAANGTFRCNAKQRTCRHAD